MKYVVYGYDGLVAQYRSTLRIVGFGWIFGLLPVGIWNMLVNGLRELISGSGSTVSTVVMGLIATEVGLFVAMFWALGTTTLTYGHAVHSLVMPSSHGMVMAITVVLSVLSICMATRVLKYSITVLGSTVVPTAVSMVCLVMFGILVLHEYRCLALSINDGALPTNMFVLTGLHFGHVCAGALVLQYAGSLIPNIYVVPRPQVPRYGHNTVVVQYLHTAAVLYMHFVEAAWIGIHGMTYL